MNIYYVANIEGLIYRGGGGAFKSTDYGETFLNVDGGIGAQGEFGWEDEEILAVGSASAYHGVLYHTYDLFKTYTQIPIDSQYVYVNPDVYRGGLPCEVYVSSRFPDWTYKVSFSADTGHTFRHVFISESYNPDAIPPMFMSDREPGVFYIIWCYIVEDPNPWGEHLKLCVEYYRDYGETLVATYCHDLYKNYGKSCESVNDLVAEKHNNNSILLTWSEPESSLPVEGYQVFRNEQLINEQLIINSSYLDENLLVGEYEYYVITYYEMGCISDSSNHVEETIEVGVKEVKELEGVNLFPNPTTGEIYVTCHASRVTNIEVFDVYGRKCHASRVTCHKNNIDISHLHAGLYFIKITTEKGNITKKIIKY
jgi:hypothetical protein